MLYRTFSYCWCRPIFQKCNTFAISLVFTHFSINFYLHFKQLLLYVPHCYKFTLFQQHPLRFTFDLPVRLLLLLSLIYSLLDDSWLKPYTAWKSELFDFFVPINCKRSLFYRIMHDIISMLPRFGVNFHTISCNNLAYFMHLFWLYFVRVFPFFLQSNR